MNLDFFHDHTFSIIATILFIIHVSGIITAISVVMSNRTTHGKIAWGLPLVIFPYLTLPLFLIFGGRHFKGYVDEIRLKDIKVVNIIKTLNEKFKTNPSQISENFKALEALVPTTFTNNNDVELLVDGDETFKAIFRGIDEAKEYVLAQFFIVANDGLGREFAQKLKNASKRGVRVYFMYDDIGCHKLPKSYLDNLEKSGVKIANFKTTKGIKNRFRLNFRNHRKIVVIDGKKAYVGGHNVGDEYIGKSHLGHWRDTHVKIEGSAVYGVQLSFLQDWDWIKKQVLDVNWEHEFSGVKDVLTLPSSPADTYETCTLFFLDAITSAKKRIWITSPYFVPDEKVIAALRLASLKGVDVRILLPLKPDHLLVYLSSFAYINDLSDLDIKFYRYKDGFLHQKVMLVDDKIASVGTANFDNRSFKINFEITMLIVDKDFNTQIEHMLENDFENSIKVDKKEYTSKPFWYKIAVRISTLFSPLQ